MTIQESKPKPITKTKEEPKLSDELVAESLIIGKVLKNIMRGLEGLPPEEDQFSSLLHINDDRERTRLSIHNIYRHSYMELLNDFGKQRAEMLGGLNSFKGFGQWAEGENIYFISQEGEGRKEAILFKRESQQPQNQLTVSLPQVETKPPIQAKRHFWQRGQTKQEGQT